MLLKIKLVTQFIQTQLSSIKICPQIESALLADEINTIHLELTQLTLI